MTEEVPSRGQRKAQKQLLDNTRAALAHGPTRLLLRWLLDRTGMFGQPVEDGSLERFLGRRDVGIELLELMNELDPYEFVRLQKEAADDIVQRRNEAKKRGEDDDDL